MNKYEFIRLLDNNTQIDNSILAELNELVNVFPYFQTAHLLLLKGLKENSDVRFESQLRNSAIHIADREVLYNLLSLSHEDRSAIRAEEIRGIEVEPVQEVITQPTPEQVQEIITQPTPEPVQEIIMQPTPEQVQEVI